MPIPTNCQFIIKEWPKKSPLINKSSSFSPLQFHILSMDKFSVGSMWGLCWCGPNLGNMLIHIFSSFSFQTIGLLWGESGDYVDLGKIWGKCWYRGAGQEFMDGHILDINCWDVSKTMLSILGIFRNFGRWAHSNVDVYLILKPACLSTWPQTSSPCRSATSAMPRGSWFEYSNVKV